MANLEPNRSGSANNASMTSSWHTYSSSHNFVRPPSPAPILTGQAKLCEEGNPLGISVLAAYYRGVMHPEHVAIVGAGAVGCYFGGMLARAGIPVTLIGRAHHIEAVQRDGLYLERKDFQEFVRLGAETEISAVGGATIVLLSVKTVDTETAAAAIAPHLREGALLVSFQNGVDNVE